ncbi:hypothetical protein ABIA16_003589 [Sinorhizobium fredii]
MFRLLAAIAVAFARLFITGLDAFTDLIARLFGGGGGPLPAPPISNLQAALPQVEEITQARELAKGQGKASEMLTKMSPSLQVTRYANATEDDRFEVDLELLTPDQQDWLTGLAEPQLKLVSKASPRQIDGALAGTPCSVPGVDSVGEDLRPVNAFLASRIADFAPFRR